MILYGLKIKGSAVKVPWYMVSSDKKIIFMVNKTSISKKHNRFEYLEIDTTNSTKIYSLRKLYFI